MKNRGRVRHYPVVLAFTGTLFVFLFIVISVIVSHHHEMMDSIKADSQRELTLVGHFVRDTLIRKDYAAVESFLRHWADEHKEIVALKATAPNEFELFSYTRTAEPAFIFDLKELVVYEGHDLMALEMKKDMSAAQVSILTLRSRLITGSVFVTALLGLVIWSTMRKLALAPIEKELYLKEQTERKFRMLLESAPDAIIYTDATGTILMVNGQTEHLFGYARSEIEGKKVETLMPSRYRRRHGELRNVFLKNPTMRAMGQNIELIGKTKTGGEFPADINLNTIETEEGPFIFCSVRDITERKIAQQKIEKGYYFQTTISDILLISLEPIPLDEQLQRILDKILSIPDLSVSSSGCIYRVNKEAETVTPVARRGFAFALSDTSDSSLPVSDCTCGSAIQLGKVQFVSCSEGLENRNSDCNDPSPHSHYCVPIISGDKTLGAINLVIDQKHKNSRDEEDLLSSVASTIAGIIERGRTNMEKLRLQEELVQAEKLSALGRLTANVAHEIRNPLALIGGFARKLHRNLSSGTKDREYWDIIISEVNRMEKILKNVLTYSRETSLNKEKYNISEIIDSVMRTYQNAFEKQNALIEKFYGPLPTIPVDKDQVWIVLNNLFSNALDSMPEGGTLTVRTENGALSGGKYVTVTVSDTGKGIPQEKINAIFEPFFSTKVLGRGTGLGLSISKKIMEDHGGRITAKSTAEEGTTFKLYFPINVENS
jgi:PAS domain S-box-containing protein